ncbi:hypothetical protein LEMLEM_LOCUS22095, partial [Lemmus lemmus]
MQPGESCGLGPIFAVTGSLGGSPQCRSRNCSWAKDLPDKRAGPLFWMFLLIQGEGLLKVQGACRQKGRLGGRGGSCGTKMALLQEL